MNYWLLTAGCGAVLLALVHIVAGGREVHRPMIATDLPGSSRLVWSVVWHLATAVMALGGVALVLAAFRPAEALVLSALPIALFLAAAGLFLFYGVTRLGSVRDQPQWLAFAGIAVVGLIGLAV